MLIRVEGKAYLKEKLGFPLQDNLILCAILRKLRIRLQTQTLLTEVTARVKQGTMPDRFKEWHLKSQENQTDSKSGTGV